MLIVILIITSAFGKKLFEQEFNTIQLNYTYSFIEQDEYIIQIDLIKFPTNKNCFPILEVEFNDTNYLLANQESYSQKLDQQRIYFKTNQSSQDIIIKIYAEEENVYSNQIGNCIMTFKLLIYENDQQLKQEICKFPTYGKHCENVIAQLALNSMNEITVKQKNWFFAYFEINSLNYQLNILNENNIVGISVIFSDNKTIYQQPSFLNNYNLLSTNEEYILNIKSTYSYIQEQQHYIVYIGIYNEQENLEQTVNIELIQIEYIILPLWAIITLILVLFSGIFIAIYIYYSYKKQYAKLIYVKPVLELTLLNKYMPALKIKKEQIDKECSVCLEQFTKKDKYRITPCNHIFHDLCLLDWTKKNANCPFCRQGLKQEEIEQYYAKIHSANNDSQNDLKHRPSGLFLPFTSTSIILQQNEKQSDQSPQNAMSESAVRGSLNINDQVIE